MSLSGFKARNHPQQVAANGADDATNDRRTPAALFSALNVWHDFTIDVAASEANAKCARFFTLENSGLSQSWRGERVWCNPPYSDCAEWVAKAWREMHHNGCELIVMLLPANRTEQKWWQSYVEPFRDREPKSRVKLSVEFLPGRIRFDRPGWTKPTKGDRPPFGLCVLTWERSSSPSTEKPE